MQELTDEQLRSIYAWIDAIPLSRPKRNMARDFSDGVLMAEVVAAYFPQLVELHNYSPGNSIQHKIYNFETLNQRVLRKFNFQLPRSTIEDIVNCKPGVVEVVLNNLQYKMAKYREKKAMKEASAAASPVSKHDTPEKPQFSQPATSRKPAAQSNGKHGAAPPSAAKHNKASVQASVDEEILLEKEEQIRELQETVEILELKIAKLEQLVRLKDNKIQKLLQKS